MIGLSYSEALKLNVSLKQENKRSNTVKEMLKQWQN